MQISIHNKPYLVKQGELSIISTLPPFQVKKGLSDLDRQVYLCNKLSRYSKNLISIGYDHGFYVPLNVTDLNVTIACADEDLEILNTNKINSKNTVQVRNYKELQVPEGSIIRIMEPMSINLNIYSPVIIMNDVHNLTGYTSFIFVNSNDNQRDISLPFNIYVYVHDKIIDDFRQNFKISETGNIEDDNLLNLLIMVKNAGETFPNVLNKNKKFTDRCCILDTGSTDNTIQNIETHLADVKYELYREPFINFRDSRNRCLQLAGQKCFFNIMLDDTYVLEGEGLRPFLYMARGDDYFDSFSLYIKDVDITYSSNRITKSYKELKYVHLLHEVIENNVNGAIPQDVAVIYDRVNPYMTARTKTRKEYDLQMLFQDLEENPTEPRTLYYIAETYLVLQDYPKALEYYRKRSDVRSGYNEEVQDSLYKVGVLSEQFLGVEWEKCHQMYLDCFNYDLSRAESLYLIGDYYYRHGHFQTAFMYLSKGFSLGVPRDKNMNIRLNIYLYHLPLVLSKCILELGLINNVSASGGMINNPLDANIIELGMECLQKMESYKNDGVVSFMKMIYNQLKINRKNLEIKDGVIVKQKISTEKTVAFVIDGGWEPWNGETLQNKGLGGSETFVIKYAETMKRMGYNSLVFCNTPEEKTYNNVSYIPIKFFASFIAKNHVDVCIINRYPEYVPVSCLNNIPTYLVMHDLSRDEDFYWKNPNLKGIMCISEWHSEYFRQKYPYLADLVKTISYGIDLNKFKVTRENRNSLKVKKSFIFPSFPNRGLLPLLQIFSKVVEKHPDAILHIFCDLKHKFVIQHFPEEMREIERLLEGMRKNVINHGWVSPLILNMYWSKCKYWLYPCKFLETCCLTAYEAAASHALAISNNLGALGESIGDRGIVQLGDVMTPEWQLQMVNTLDNLLANENEENSEVNNLLDKNYEWIQTKAYETVAGEFSKKYIDVL